jgi:hypothetical protein
MMIVMAVGIMPMGRNGTMTGMIRRAPDRDIAAKLPGQHTGGTGQQEAEERKKHYCLIH